MCFWTLTFKTMFTCTERHRKPTKVIITLLRFMRNYTNDMVHTSHKKQKMNECKNKLKISHIKNFHVSYHTKNDMVATCMCISQ